MLNNQQVLDALIAALNFRIEEYISDLDDIKNSLNSAEKSSAGDKHETSRAHLQIEQERISNQLDVLIKQRGIVLSIKPNKTNKILSGTLTKTNKGFFFISISFGKLKVADVEVFCLSPTSPMGAQLINKTKNDSFQLNTNTIEIIDFINN